MTRLEEMKALATEEAIKLKEHATKEERAKLSFKRFNPSSSMSCIYGQMTGYCSNDRAASLISLCCKRVYNVATMLDTHDSPLNGAPYEIEDDRPRHCHFQSPIELLIYEENGGEESAKKLIAFLKDETQTLEL